MWAEWIKDWYSQGFYTKDEVKVFVEVKWITSLDYKEITGDVYVTV